MADAKTDRRVRRTKALLLQGLMQLMESKDVKDISVKELADLADINRGTFYLHYSDVYDMLSQIEDELFVEFHEIIDRTLTPDVAIYAPRATLLEIFSFLERHRAPRRPGLRESAERPGEGAAGQHPGRQAGRQRWLLHRVLRRVRLHRRDGDLAGPAGFAEPGGHGGHLWQDSGEGVPSGQKGQSPAPLILLLSFSEEILLHQPVRQLGEQGIGPS